MNDPHQQPAAPDAALDGVAHPQDAGRPADTIALAPPPVTGHRVVDEAMREVADLGSLPVDGHHDRLQAAQEVLQGVLNASREHLQPTIPGVPTPRG